MKKSYVQNSPRVKVEKVTCEVVQLTSIEVESKLLHLVRVAVLAEALDAEVVVVADGAVVPRLHALRAVVARVDEFVLTLGVKLVQQHHRRVLGPPEGRKLEMLLSGHRQESVSPVHQVARHEAVRILDGREAGGRLGRVKPDGEEDFLVLLHGGEHLLREVAASTLRYLLLVVLPLGRR